MSVVDTLRDHARTFGRLEDLARRSLTCLPSQRPDLSAETGGNIDTTAWLEYRLRAVEAAKDRGAVDATTLEAIRRAAPIVGRWDHLRERNATDQEVQALGDMRRAFFDIARKLEE